MSTSKTELKTNIVETFYSVQGEAKYTGSPSLFVRLFGCNFQCNNFGQPRGNPIPIKEMPHATFDMTGITSLADLPIFDVGCDSSAAWSKKYRHLTKEQTTAELIQDCADLHKDVQGVPHLVITGGEPLLKRNQEFLLELIQDSPYKYITIETNGTQLLTPDFVWGVLDLMRKDELILTFSVSPKLSISGEQWKRAIKPEVVQQYVDIFSAPCAMNKGEVYLKFVVRDKLCIPEVKLAIDLYEFQGDVYLMSEGATVEGQSVTESVVADLCLQHNYIFSPRLHIALYGNSWNT